jgi:hypothetical protein
MNPEEPKKEVKLRVTEDELQSLSRTRRRRRRGAAPLRADLTVEDTVDVPKVSIVKKQEEEPKAEAKNATEAKAEATTASVLVAKANKASLQGNPSTAPLPANPNVKIPKIIYTKKRHVHIAPKTSIVIPTKTAFAPKELVAPPKPILRQPLQTPSRKPTPANVLPKVPTPSKTRKFKAKRLSFTVNSKRLTSERFMAARVSKMPLSEVKQKLVAANLLKGKSKSPEPVLRGMLVNWMLLHTGA